MAAARRKIRPEDIHGLKYFKALQGLIERLHFVGTHRDKGASLCGYRLHTQFEVLRGIPSRIDVTPLPMLRSRSERAS
jgi:hypothetical protein